ncbi:MAG: hypothetical protein HZT40_20650 [Candidatus Thiothrix singaporensis]|uniref:Uncharacterized protein n=1 Tax=Candidatus Thiothrix singaporensis TaxID=2799669 RepID=A0A7L6AWP3_9GAMM|nr:MAG: hypothetical protein HZT40_20650 [Candidatus Thiothrix singaporensis]
MANTLKQELAVLNDVKQQRAELQEQVEGLESECKQLTETNAHLTAELAKQKAAIDSLNSSQIQDKWRREELQQEGQSQKKRIAELEAKNTELQGFCDSQQQQINALNEAQPGTEKQQELGFEMQDKTNSILRLEKAQATLQQENQQQAATISELTQVRQQKSCCRPRWNNRKPVRLPCKKKSSIWKSWSAPSAGNWMCSTKPSRTRWLGRRLALPQ